MVRIKFKIDILAQEQERSPNSPAKRENAGNEQSLLYTVKDPEHTTLGDLAAIIKRQYKLVNNR